MFALAAVILFVVAAVKVDSFDTPLMWVVLGLIALAVHSVWDYLPVGPNRRGLPPQA